MSVRSVKKLRDGRSKTIYGSAAHYNEACQLVARAFGLGSELLEPKSKSRPVAEEALKNLERAIKLAPLNRIPLNARSATTVKAQQLEIKVLNSLSVMDPGSRSLTQNEFRRLARTDSDLKPLREHAEFEGEFWKIVGKPGTPSVPDQH